VPHHSTLRPRAAALLTLIFGLSGCAATPEEEGTGDSSGFCEGKTASLVSGSGVPESPATPLSETPDPTSSCNAVVREFASEEPTHVVECIELEYSTNPPCTGMHYGIWPEYRVYEEAIPRGFVVHALEHGAVSLAYACTDCPDEVAAAVALLDEVAEDPECGGTSSRTLLWPDPRLETNWAAASWGFTLTADCFEPDVFRAFIEAHRGNGLEEVCSHGLDVSEPPP
jgi:hypothetical protein